MLLKTTHRPYAVVELGAAQPGRRARLFTTKSLGELSRLPSNRSASTVISPSYSVRVTRRVRCSQEIRWPWRSRVVPFAWFDGLRSTPTAPVASSQCTSRLLGMSLQMR